MPARLPTLTRDEAQRTVAARGFDRPPTDPAPAGQVGIELEWLTVDARDPGRPASRDAVEAVAESLAPLPGGSVVTFEPGPRRERAVHNPRYDAMEAYFDQSNGAGRTMMRSTAALQVNVDLGDAANIERRWRAAHDLGPVLAASFANSPIGDDGPTGYRSTRLAVWAAIDRWRTSPAVNHADCRASWADYALAAPVMLVRTTPERHVPVLRPLSFDEWIDQGHDLGWPTLDDLE